MKTTIIKSISIVIAMMFCMNPTLYGNNESNRESKKIVILRKVHKTVTSDRSLSADIVATYYVNMDCIGLVCDGTKETSVYIVDSKGEEISYDSFDAGMNPYYMVDVPQTPGTYYIIIDSPVLYAECALVGE